MIKQIDSFLNNITMYRVVLYGLIVVAFFAVVFGFTGDLPFTGLQLLSSLCISVGSCLFANFVLSRVFQAVTNVESAAISGLILFFLFAPVQTQEEVMVLGFAGLLAMASKYLFAIHKKHLFNPVAIAAVVASYVFQTGATWWVGSYVLLPATAITGILIVRKIRRHHLFLSFAVSSTLTILFFSWLNKQETMSMMSQLFMSWPILFFGSYMLTEPLTTPPTKQLQVLYGVLVGFLFGVPMRLGVIHMTPELALVLGNVFSYLVSPKQKLLLKLKEKIQLKPSLYDFVFTPSQRLAFVPGQYLEWTLPNVSLDSRGNRRYFTIASSPTEPEIRLGVKIPEKASSFKQTLQSLKKGDVMLASQLAGDFTLPEDQRKKLVFIAGGIGITPFRSMIQYLIDTKQKRDIVLLYTASTAQEFTYQDVFDKAAKQLGVQVEYVITHADQAPKNWKGQVGRITPEMITRVIPDFSQRVFYLSGPQAMVTSYKEVIESLQVPHSQIVTDYFPGF